MPVMQVLMDTGGIAATNCFVIADEATGEAQDLVRGNIAVEGATEGRG